MRDRDVRHSVFSFLFTSFVGLLVPFPSHAGDDYIPGTRFVTVAEPSSLRTPQAFSHPANIAENFFRAQEALPTVDLMSWTMNNHPAPRPRRKYDRQNQFGSWLVRNPNQNCFDTRALVLIRDSKRRPTPGPNPCYVAGGAWHDPYTHQIITDAKKIQIDHVVALKNAYISGAFAWNNKARCAYANFLGSEYHLLPVDARANNQKGDATPARWVPPNPAFRCAYLSAWLRVKAVWRLMMSEEEAQAIHSMVRQFNCRPAEFRMTALEIAEQRNRIDQGIEECPATPPRPRIPNREDEASGNF